MLKYLRRFKSSSLIRSDLPSQATKVAHPDKHYYEMSEYQNSSLQRWFNQEALLWDPETIIEKSDLKDYDFFLK